MSQKLKRWLMAALAGAALNGLPSPAHAESAAHGPASDRWAVILGAFFSGSDTGIRLGSGLGLEIDLEDALDYDSDTAAFRTEAYWRFASNHKHRIDVSWFAIRRSANQRIGQDIDVEDDNGAIITIPTGSD